MADDYPDQHDNPSSKDFNTHAGDFEDADAADNLDALERGKL